MAMIRPLFPTPAPGFRLLLLVTIGIAATVKARLFRDWGSDVEDVAVSGLAGAQAGTLSKSIRLHVVVKGCNQRAPVAA